MSGPVLEVGYKAEYIWEQNRQGLCLCGTYIHVKYSGLPLCGSAGKESACNVGNLGLIPGLGRSPEEGNYYTLQYSVLENSMDCVVHGFRKNGT